VRRCLLSGALADLQITCVIQEATVHGDSGLLYTGSTTVAVQVSLQHALQRYHGTQPTPILMHAFLAFIFRLCQPQGGTRCYFASAPTASLQA